mgnify:FL=1
MSYEFVENKLKSQKKLRECLGLNEETAVLIYVDKLDNYKYLKYEVAQENWASIKKGDIVRYMGGSTNFIQDYQEKCGLTKPN